MAVKAYILITVETALTREVLNRLRNLRNVTEVNEVLGPYDIVAELEVDRFEDVTDILRQEVRPIPGIRNTLTCVAMR
jgi:DNA-binding Lrp family transcriptional regulator